MMNPMVCHILEGEMPIEHLGGATRYWRDDPGSVKRKAD